MGDGDYPLTEVFISMRIDSSAVPCSTPALLSMMLLEVVNRQQERYAKALSTRA
jgi:hypothetical protein